MEQAFNISKEKGLRYSMLLLRLGLGISFLSAVADRFGLWGPAGASGIAWGNFEAFQSYTATLNWFAPLVMIPVLAWTATVVEIIVGLMLILGIRLQIASLLSALLLTAFFLTMLIALGPKAPLDYSVLTGVGASFLLFFTLKK